MQVETIKDIKMKKFLTLFFTIVLSAGQAFAADGCYTPREAEAEQGIRIHSELMVIGLNCMHIPQPGGKNLYTEHQKFTQKHAKLIASYENILMDYMRKSGNSNPEAGLHKIRTDFANKISYDAAEMRPDIFCKTYAPRIQKAAQMDETTLRKWASMSFKGHSVTHPICK